MNSFKDSVKCLTEEWGLERKTAKSLRISFNKVADCADFQKKNGGNIGLIIVLKEAVFELWCKGQPSIKLTTTALVPGSLILVPGDPDIVVEASLTGPTEPGETPNTISQDDMNAQIPAALVGTSLCALVVRHGRLMVPSPDILDKSIFKGRAGVYLCYNTNEPPRMFPALLASLT